MASPFFDPVIARYIRERLASECKACLGATTEIARQCGLSKAHISSLVEGSRGVSVEVAAILCKYWGIKQATCPISLTRPMAVASLPTRSPKHIPSSNVSLEFCRTSTRTPSSPNSNSQPAASPIDQSSTGLSSCMRSFAPGTRVCRPMSSASTATSSVCACPWQTTPRSKIEPLDSRTQKARVAIDS